MLSALDLLRELRVRRTESHPLGAGKDEGGPWPVCATCGEPITGEGVTVICGGARHAECAPHGGAVAS